MSSAPFVVEAWGGLGVTAGIVSLADGVLRLQHRTRDDVIHVVKTATRTVELPLSAVLEVRFKAGWMSGWLTVRVDDLALLDNVPGADNGELRLKIARRDRASAAELAADVNLAAAEARRARWAVAHAD